MSRLIKAVAVVAAYAGMCAAIIFAFNAMHPALRQDNSTVFVLLTVLLSGVLPAIPLTYLYLMRYRYWLKGHQATSLAHELKSPLATIIVASETLLDFSKRNPLESDKQITYLKIIQRNVAALDRFVQDLLSVVSIGSGQVTLEKQPTDLSRVVRDAVEDISLLAAEKGIDLRMELASIEPLVVDPTKIRQVLVNLLSNAVKFSEHGDIVVRLRRGEQHVLCTVTDSGIGIARNELRRVFDRFFHGKASSKGSGMGLTIAKGWVEAHGGKIWAESDGVGRGATISFTLPIETSSAVASGIVDGLFKGA